MPSSLRIGVVSLLVAGATSIVAPARADEAGAAPAAPYAYSYEIENVDTVTDKTLVVWPRACTALGEPLGKVDLAMNPDWSTRMNDVDYEVLVKGKHHELLDSCKKSTRLYALPVDAFPRGSRAATADDTSIGQKEVGAQFVILPALDAIDRKKRIDFFEKDPRVVRTAFVFDALEPARVGKPTKPLKAVHELLAVGGFNATSFVVSAKRVVYTYQDGTAETIESPLAEANADASAKANANSTVTADPPANTAAGGAQPSDVGTRWVYLAAVGGLVVGGIIAFMRKKRA